MTVTEVVMVISAILTPLIAGGVAIAVAFINGKVNTTKKDVAETKREVEAAAVLGKDINHKAEALVVKADEIHTLTNSNLSEVKADFAAAQKRIEKLEALVTRLVDKVPPAAVNVLVANGETLSGTTPPVQQADRIEAKTEKIDKTTVGIQSRLEGQSEQIKEIEDKQEEEGK